MKNTSILAILALCAVLTFVVAEEASANSDVLVLNGNNFADAIEDNPVILVEFYAPWCGHCKQLAPEYEKAATALKGRFPLAKVDCTTDENQPLCGEQGIQGFPTLKVFRDGKPFEAEVVRKADALIKFGEAELLPPLSVIETEDQLKEHLTKHQIAVIGFLDNDHDDRFTALQTVARKLKAQVFFGVVVNKDFAKTHTNDASVPTVVVFRQGDDNAVFSGDFANDLERFVNIQRVPLLAEIGPDNYKMYVEVGSVPIGFVFLDLTEDNEATKATFKTLAAANRGKMFFTIVDNKRFSGQATRMGLTGTVTPSFAIDNPATGFHYAFPEDQTLSQEDATKFVAEFLEGKLEPTIKSEPIPETNDGPVKVVVAKSYEAIVNDPTKDVLVEFYAPWCGHCKALVPVYEELGQYFQKWDSVVIAKIDATANDVSPTLGIRGFPTLIFFPADNKDKFVEYQGSRDIKDLKKFVVAQASKKLDLSEAELAALSAVEEDEDEDEHDGHGHGVKDEL